MPLTRNGRIFYRINEACTLAGTSRDTFLRWTRQKKFADVEFRDRNGWRLFTEADLERLKTRVNLVEKVGTTKSEAD